jgi:SagB-type dehydrogenase family enzyme
MTDDRSLIHYLAPDRFVSPVRDEVETFHGTTKLFRATAGAFFRGSLEYMLDERGRVEMTHNRRRYGLAESVRLPDVTPCDATLDACLASRRSVRAFEDAPIPLAVLSNILGAARVRRHLSIGSDSTASVGMRSYPSAGGLFPIETYAALLNVDGIRPCVAYYDPFAHAIVRVEDLLETRHFNRTLAASDATAASPPSAPVVIFACALFERSAVKYMQRGYRFALLEAGMVTYLYSLAAVANGFGSLHWGGFFDDEINSCFDLDGLNETIVDCLFVGKPATGAPTGIGPEQNGA